MAKEKLINGILKTMREKGDFPALSTSVSEILNALRDTEHTSIDAVVSHVMSDYALSQKVLRLANSAMYRSMGGPVTSLTRAIMVLGLDAVTYLALGLKLLDCFDMALGQQAETKKVLGQATLAANITRQLASKSGTSEGEEAVVLSLFCFLGQLVLMLYAADVWERCRAECGQDIACLNRVLRRDYGTDTYDIAQTLARRWGFPEPICDNIRPFEPAPEQENGALTHGEWSRALVSVGSELALAVTGQDAEAEVGQILAQYGELLALDTAHMEATVANVRDSDLLQEVLEAAQAAPETPVNLLEEALNEADVLLAQTARPSEMLSLLLETAHRALHFQRTVFFVRNAANRCYVASAGLGQGAAAWLDRLHFDSDFAPDVFHLSLTRDMPVKLDRLAAANSRVPNWYRHASPEAKSCLIVPVVVDGKAAGLLLGEWDVEEPFVPSGDLDLLLSLKSKLIRAMSA